MEMNFARELADRIVFMAGGELLVEKPVEFFLDPSDPSSLLFPLRCRNSLRFALAVGKRT